MGIADELDRLARLHSDGALSDAEYDAAKQVVIIGSGQPPHTVADAHPQSHSVDDRRESNLPGEGVRGSDGRWSAERRDGLAALSAVGLPKLLAVGTGLVAVLILIFMLNGGGGSNGARCDAWPDTAGQWYSVPVELERAIANHDRVVNKNAGIWSHPTYGGMNGWVYAAEAPDGAVAYWGVIGNTKHASWYALNDQAAEIARTVSAPIGISSPPDMLTVEVRQEIEECLDQ